MIFTPFLILILFTLLYMENNFLIYNKVNKEDNIFNTTQIHTESENISIDNFKSDLIRNIDININNINFCSNPIYKIIINVILCIIIIYFIWFVSRKDYNINYYEDLISTPFTSK